ncbi:MAG: RIP metalloprotease RseP [Clostridia bacterium]|nr:RIP metalloprotease RseP [Clostridia bacterium]
MIWTVLFALLIFSLIIFVHELGHFITARIFGVTVHEFALGMGPKIFSKEKNGTKYSLRLIPIGGFCSMEGEDEASSEEGALSSKSWWKKLIILAAGALMNVLLGFVITTVFVTVNTKDIGIPSLIVDSVMEQSPLSDFLQPEDKVIELNQKSVHIKKDIDFAMQQSGGKVCEITIDRGGEKLKRTFTPLAAKYTDGTPAYMIGFVPVMSKPTVFNVLREGFFQTVWMGKIVFVSIGMLISGQASVSDVSGPVGVVDAMNTQAQAGGFVALLYLAGFISVNIGIMNLLPIPALDGGRIFFVLVEAIRRKPIPPEKEGMVHFVGLVLLMGVMVMATWNDIMRLISGT